MEEKPKKLQFLYDMQAEAGMGKFEFARLMETTPQNMFTYEKRDDMKLSYAQEIADKMGYRLSYQIVAKDAEAKVQSNKMIGLIDSMLGSQAMTRLGFLLIALKAHGIDRHDLATKLGLNYTAVNRWFKVDDIAISYLYEIAELYDLELVCTYKKKRRSRKAKPVEE